MNDYLVHSRSFGGGINSGFDEENGDTANNGHQPLFTKWVKKYDNVSLVNWQVLSFVDECIFFISVRRKEDYHGARSCQIVLIDLLWTTEEECMIEKFGARWYRTNGFHFCIAWLHYQSPRVVLVRGLVLLECISNSREKGWCSCMLLHSIMIHFCNHFWKIRLIWIFYILYCYGDWAKGPLAGRLGSFGQNL